MSALPGSELADRYRIERELGQGGMATVYLAEDLKLGRKVAVKVLRPELAAVLGTERFLAEIQTTAQLQHPNILTLHDSGEAGELLFYVMPYVTAETLRARLTREKQLGLEDALTITRQVAGALDHAHRHGVIHRDIKPENILLAESQALLADFGIALAVKQAGGNRLTGTGISLGTPEYMSPEQATGDRELDGRSDVYSLAAVLYEMLAGEPPHTGPTAQAVIAKLMTTPPTPLRVVRPSVPEAVETAVMKGLAKVPADRYASAGEFAAGLLRSGRPRPAAGLRWRPLIAVGLAGLALLVIAILATGRGPSRGTPRPDRVQLTFTGNARTPALTADGTRLAYSTRRCGDQGECTSDVLVQDVGGAGSATILRGWASIWSLAWSGNGRHLLVNGLQGPGKPWGLFGVPALGGPPVLLGASPNYGGAMVGTSDTVLAYWHDAADTVTWLRWISITDGVLRDSLPVRHRGAETITASPFPDARRVMVIRSRTGAGWIATVMDRAGRSGDSLKVEGALYGAPKYVPWLSHDGQFLLLPSRPSPASDAFDLLAYRVGPSGRIGARADTVLRHLRGTATDAPNGSLLLAEGPVQFEVWAVSRPSPVSMQFTEHRLADATLDLAGVISPPGDRVLLQRALIQSDTATIQLSVLPFDGGPELPVGGPGNNVGGTWSWDGKEVITARLAGDSTYILQEADPTSSHSRPFLSVPAESILGPPQPLPGGGALFPHSLGILRIGVPGFQDTTFLLPAPGLIAGSITGSPDGRAVVRIAFDANADSVVVDRVSLVNGHVTRLAALYADAWDQPYWFSDGSLLLQILEGEAALTWYRLPADGGRLARLGTPPRPYPASYRFSRDGRHAVVNLREDRPDVYLIRNFTALMDR